MKPSGCDGKSTRVTYHADTSATHPIAPDYVLWRGGPIPEGKKYSTKPVERKMKREIEGV